MKKQSRVVVAVMAIVMLVLCIMDGSITGGILSLIGLGAAYAIGDSIKESSKNEYKPKL